MRRPVETKGRHLPEKRLAQKWHTLLKHTPSLAPSVLVEAETLHEKFQNCDVNILATWMNEYKRCPRRGRGGDEDKLARQWKQLLLKANDLPPKLKGVVMRLRYRLSTDPAWIDPSLHADYEAVEAWMESHKRCPRWECVGEERRMAKKWYHLRSLRRCSLLSGVCDGVETLKRQSQIDPVWIEAEKAEEALAAAPQLVACETVKAWMELHKRHPRRGRVVCEGRMAKPWRHLHPFGSAWCHTTCRFQRLDLRIGEARLFLGVPMISFPNQLDIGSKPATGCPTPPPKNTSNLASLSSRRLTPKRNQMQLE